MCFARQELKERQDQAKKPQDQASQESTDGTSDLEDMPEEVANAIRQSETNRHPGTKPFK